MKMKTKQLAPPFQDPVKPTGKMKNVNSMFIPIGLWTRLVKQRIALNI